MRRMWCKIAKIRDKVIIGFTPDDEKVLLSNKGRLIGVQPGDIIAFVPYPPTDPTPHPFHSPAKWYAGDPQIIARGIVADRPARPDTRPRKEGQADANPIAWKQKHETAMDAQCFREIRVGTTSSVAGATCT